MLNSPCNPTGAVIDRARFQALADLAVEHDLLLISDETYEELVYEPAEHTSAGHFHEQLGDRMVLISSFSKTFCMTGFRVGYLLAAPELVRGVRLHLRAFVSKLREGDIERAQLGLAHSFSRCKVKFDVNRADKHIIQSIAILDTLDKVHLTTEHCR